MVHRAADRVADAVGEILRRGHGDEGVVDDLGGVFLVRLRLGGLDDLGDEVPVLVLRLERNRFDVREIGGNGHRVDAVTKLKGLCDNFLLLAALLVGEAGQILPPVRRDLLRRLIQGGSVFRVIIGACHAAAFGFATVENGVRPAFGEIRRLTCEHDAGAELKPLVHNGPVAERGVGRVQDTDQKITRERILVHIGVIKGDLLLALTEYIGVLGRGGRIGLPVPVLEEGGVRGIRQDRARLCLIAGKLLLRAAAPALLSRGQGFLGLFQGHVLLGKGRACQAQQHHQSEGQGEQTPERMVQVCSLLHTSSSLLHCFCNYTIIL